MALGTPLPVGPAAAMTPEVTSWMLAQAHQNQMAVPPNPLYQPMFGQGIYSPQVSPMPGSGLFGPEMSSLMSMGVQMAPMLLGLNGYRGDPFGTTMTVSDRALQGSRAATVNALAENLVQGDSNSLTSLFTGISRMKGADADKAKVYGEGMSKWIVENASTDQGRMVIGQLAAMGIIPMEIMDVALPSFYLPDQMQQLNERRYSSGRFGNVLSMDQMVKTAQGLQEYFKDPGRRYGFSIREAGEMALSLEARGLLPSYEVDKLGSITTESLGRGNTRMYASTRGMLEAQAAVIDSGLLPKNATSEMALGAIQTITGGGLGHMSEGELVTAVNRFKEIQRMTGIAVSAMANIINGVAQLARENNLDPTAMVQLAGESLLMGKSAAVNLTTSFGTNVRAGVVRDPVALAGVLQERQAAAASSMFAGRLANIQRLIDMAGDKITPEIKKEYADLFSALGSANSANPKVDELRALANNPARAIDLLSRAGFDTQTAMDYINSEPSGRVSAGLRREFIRAGVAAQFSEVGEEIRYNIGGIREGASNTDVFKAAFIATAVKNDEDARKAISELLGQTVDNNLLTRLRTQGEAQRTGAWGAIAFGEAAGSVVEKIGGKLAATELLNAALPRENFSERLFTAITDFVNGKPMDFKAFDFYSKAKLLGGLIDQGVPAKIDELKKREKDKTITDNEREMLRTLEASMSGLIPNYEALEGTAAERFEKARGNIGEQMAPKGASKELQNLFLDPTGPNAAAIGARETASAAQEILNTLARGIKLTLVGGGGQSLGEALATMAANTPPGTPSSAENRPSGGSSRKTMGDDTGRY